MSIEAEQLAAYMDGRLGSEDRALVERHLAECAECREIAADGVPTIAGTSTVPAARPRTTASRWMGRAAVGLAAAAAVALVVRVGLVDRSDPSVALLQKAAGETRPFDVRLTAGLPYRPVAPITRSVEQAPLSADQQLAAASLEKHAHVSPTAANLHVFGEAQILTRDVDGAIRTLEQAAAAAPGDGRVQVDLAAAYVSRGRERNAAADYTSALVALDRAADQQVSPEAVFNRALALEGLGRQADARAAWQRYLALDAESGWASEARAHVAALDSSGTIVR